MVFVNYLHILLQLLPVHHHSLFWRVLSFERGCIGSVPSTSLVWAWLELSRLSLIFYWGWPKHCPYDILSLFLTMLVFLTVRDKIYNRTPRIIPRYRISTGNVRVQLLFKFIQGHKAKMVLTVVIDQFWPSILLKQERTSDACNA